MKRSILSLVMIIAFAFFAAQPSFSQQMPMNGGKANMMRGGRAPMMRAMHNENIMKMLKLTDQQKEKIAQLKIDFSKKMVDLRADLQKSKLDLKDLRVKGDISRNGVISAVKKINESRDAIAVAVANHMMDVYEVLTPDQQKIWLEHAPQMLGHRKAMRGGMRQWRMRK